MTGKLCSDQDVFRKMIDIGLRTYGDGHAYPTAIVEIVHQYCREQLSSCLIKHQQLLAKNTHLSFLMTLVYLSRHRRARLERFEHFLQAKERPEQAAGEGEQQRMAKTPRVTLNERFRRICRQLRLDLYSNERHRIGSSTPRLDRQRSRQYARLDNYYRSDLLTPSAYLSFVEQQHTHFNRLRALSSVDILQWLQLTDRCSSSSKSLNSHELRLAELCLFLLKEILLELMDEVHQSTVPCAVPDVLRRRYVQQHRRCPYSGRKRRRKH